MTIEELEESNGHYIEHLKKTQRLIIGSPTCEKEEEENMFSELMTMFIRQLKDEHCLEIIETVWNHTSYVIAKSTETFIRSIVLKYINVPIKHYNPYNLTNAKKERLWKKVTKEDVLSGIHSSLSHMWGDDKEKYRERILDLLTFNGPIAAAIFCFTRIYLTEEIKEDLRQSSVRKSSVLVPAVYSTEFAKGFSNFNDPNYNNLPIGLKWIKTEKELPEKYTLIQGLMTENSSPIDLIYGDDVFLFSKTVYVHKKNIGYKHNMSPVPQYWRYRV